MENNKSDRTRIVGIRLIDRLILTPICDELPVGATGFAPHMLHQYHQFSGKLGLVTPFD